MVVILSIRKGTDKCPECTILEVIWTGAKKSSTSLIWSTSGFVKRDKVIYEIENDSQNRIYLKRGNKLDLKCMLYCLSVTFFDFKRRKRYFYWLLVAEKISVEIIRNLDLQMHPYDICSICNCWCILVLFRTRPEVKPAHHPATYMNVFLFFSNAIKFSFCSSILTIFCYLPSQS